MVLLDVVGYQMRHPERFVGQFDEHPRIERLAKIIDTSRVVYPTDDVDCLCARKKHQRRIFEARYAFQFLTQFDTEASINLHVANNQIRLDTDYCLTGRFTITRTMAFVSALIEDSRHAGKDDRIAVDNQDDWVAKGFIHGSDNRR